MQGGTFGAAVDSHDNAWLTSYGGKSIAVFDKNGKPLTPAFLAKAVNAGAKCEQKFEGGAHPPIAFCSDPFGNGFCVVGTIT
jgi:hypothetical protein